MSFCFFFTGRKPAERTPVFRLHIIMTSVSVGVLPIFQDQLQSNLRSWSRRQ